MSHRETSFNITVPDQFVNDFITACNSVHENREISTREGIEKHFVYVKDTKIKTRTGKNLFVVTVSRPYLIFILGMRYRNKIEIV